MMRLGCSAYSKNGRPSEPTTNRSQVEPAVAVDRRPPPAQPTLGQRFQLGHGRPRRRRPAGARSATPAAPASPGACGGRLSLCLAAALLGCRVAAPTALPPDGPAAVARTEAELDLNIRGYTPTKSFAIDPADYDRVLALFRGGAVEQRPLTWV